MRVLLSKSEFLDELAEALRAADCVVRTVGDRSVDVAHPLAHDEEEARLEVAFFVRAWQASHPELAVHLVT